ncbi:MAG: hypothetical protein HY700_19635 [Gemmatimonadetes bacterium]|nr:hypothetical protein [Gemmatimonadota bacterium]
MTVCIGYTGVQFGDEQKLRLFQREVDPATGGETWVDRTASEDPASDVICATVGSLGLFLVAERAVLEVGIDIKPGSDPNTINLGSGGTVPVGILSSADFDARTVDPLTVTLAGAAVKLRGKGTAMAAAQDVNADGVLDLVVHVETSALELTEGDIEGVLEGQTFGGVRIRGADSVRIVP